MVLLQFKFIPRDLLRAQTIELSRREYRALNLKYSQGISCEQYDLNILIVSLS